MAVETTNAFSGPFLPNGATVVFPFDFTAPSVEEVVVLLRTADGAESFPTDFEVKINPGSGGNVTFLNPPAAGPELYILLDPDFRQQIGFENGTAWLAEPVNEVADRGAARDQVLRRDINRSTLFPIGEQGGVLPPASVRAGKFRAWDGAGREVPATGTGNDPDFRTDWADPDIGGLLGAFRNVGLGSVVRTIFDKLVETLSAADKAADPTGIFDSSTALQNLFADMATTGRADLGGNVRYKLTKPLVIPPGILLGGNVVLDFSAADPTDFPDGRLVTMQGTAPVKIANLDTDMAIGDRGFSFAANHGLLTDETFQLSGTVDYAGNGARAYYRKGEMFRVATVDDPTTVQSEMVSRDTYAYADVEVWKRSGDRFTQGCASLTIIGPDTIDYVVELVSLDRTTIDNLRAVGGKFGAIAITDCFGLTGKNVDARQTSNAGGGSQNYGIIVSKSQDVRINGRAYGYFNGFTVGGTVTAGGRIGMNRDIHFEGIAGSHPTGGLAGFNLHGNSEYCSGRGVFSNGIVLGGNNNEAHGTFIKNSGFSPVQFSEMHGADFTVTGTLRTAGPAFGTTTGAIHQTGMGVNSAAPGNPSTLRYGGRTTIDLKYYSPNATRMVLWRPTDLARNDVILDLRLDIMQAHPSSRFMIFTKNSSGNDFPRIEINRFNYLDAAAAITWSLNPATVIANWRQEKTAAVSGSGAATYTQAVTFDVPFPRTPRCMTSINGPSYAGTSPLAETIKSVTASGGTVELSTTDKANQTVSTSVVVTATSQ